MKYALEQFIDEAIQLELNAAEIYLIFPKMLISGLLLPGRKKTTLQS